MEPASNNSPSPEEGKCSTSAPAIHRTERRSRLPAGQRLGTPANADVFTMNVDGTHIRYVTRTFLWESYPDWGTRH
jgi:hypothetical protein